jgi:hypothetical protein
MLWPGLMGLAALLLLSSGERREKSETRAGRAQEEAGGVPGSRYDSKSFREMRIPAINPRRQSRRASQIVAHLVI